MVLQPKSVTLDPDLDPEVLPAVSRAEQMLERILGRAASRVDVRWQPGRAGDGIDRSVLLRLTDSGVTKEYDFLDWEFREDIHVRRRLREVWDAVLSERLRRELVETGPDNPSAGE